MTTTESIASADPSSAALQLERHAIDFIPLSERHGKPRDLFTLWFGANAMAVTLATGAIAATTGVGLLWGSIAIIIGSMIGTVFMAYHSAQGPQLGLPQMIQSRAQFGFYGANIPMLIVIAMYLGFFAGAILGAQALSLLFGMSVAAGVAVSTLMSLVLVIFGYNLMHLVGRIITPIYIVVFSLITFTLIVHWRPSTATTAVPATHFEIAPFLMIVSTMAAYYISYGPYVADYSRYLPVRTTTGQAFWYTYAGAIASAIWIMVLGAAIQTAFSRDDTITATANVAGGMGAWLRVTTLITLVLGLANIDALNLYGAMMSSLTITTSLFERMNVTRLRRVVYFFVLAMVGGLIAGAASNDFRHAYENFIFFIITFLIPWSAINLVDYYWIRRGRYAGEELFTANGRYGKFNVPGLSAYALGCLCEIPFISQEFYTGPVAARLGFDVAWVVGLIVPGAIYFVLTQRSRTVIDSALPAKQAVQG